MRAVLVSNRILRKINAISYFSISAGSSIIFNIHYKLSVQDFRSLHSSNLNMEKFRVAVIGQSVFAAEVYKLIQRSGHKVVGVFTVPDNIKEDPIAVAAREDGVPVFKYKSWRKKEISVLPEILEEYSALGAELNVMPYCSQFIPMEIINMPRHKSICYHPSLLPAHRGASAINWTLIDGDSRGGFTIFWPNEGLDTGPILLQKMCDINVNDTVDSLYKRFMFPEGIKAMVEAVNLVACGQAPVIKQPTEGASYDEFLNKPEVCRLPLNVSGQRIHNFIRGLDSSPGAWVIINGQVTHLFGSKRWSGCRPDDIYAEVSVEGMALPGYVHAGGLLLTGSDLKMVNVRMLSIDGNFMSASRLSQLGTSDDHQMLECLQPEENIIKEKVRSVWADILKQDILEQTDFFVAGGGSVDIVRLVEEIKDAINVSVVNEDVFMCTTFEQFIMRIIKKIRDGDSGSQAKKIIPPSYDPVSLNVNNIDVRFPHQMFIDGTFVDATSGKYTKIYNPHDESLICEVGAASAQDVDRAVKAAECALKGEWGKMSPRERGRLLFQLAQLMDDHKTELATIETIDSGAVYNLALKTHVGMSIETWRYFAGWTDKIEGSTIPINNARPNLNLSITKKEPIGVCGLITPWNYPLMMLSWKMAACLAAGNTVVIKPAQVCPLTALKFAELSVMAGIPPGVINVTPGSGSVCGEAIAHHPRIRKLGFTGSTDVGHMIMRSCADSNLKKVSLELGGKSPLIIFADADLDKAVRNAISGVFFNKGENCIAAGRLFVEETIYEKFLQLIVTEVKKMKVGNPFNHKTVHGPQNHLAHLEKLVEFCDKGVAEGARLLIGGRRVAGPGLYMEPTVFGDVEDGMFIAQEESFGPIMVVSSFYSDDIDGVIKRANATKFGLASGVFTQDVNKALYVSERIDAGTCFVNTYNKTDVAAPFGGFKMSGFGKDLGREAIDEYLKTKTITFEYNIS